MSHCPVYCSGSLSCGLSRQQKGIFCLGRVKSLWLLMFLNIIYSNRFWHIFCIYVKIAWRSLFDSLSFCCLKSACRVWMPLKKIVAGKVTSVHFRSSGPVCFCYFWSPNIQTAVGTTETGGQARACSLSQLLIKLSARLWGQNSGKTRVQNFLRWAIWQQKPLRGWIWHPNSLVHIVHT